MFCVAASLTTKPITHIVGAIGKLCKRKQIRTAKRSTERSTTKSIYISKCPTDEQYRRKNKR